eukprot:scaffold34698_cov173-Amphora_coffeaeformis.AAC.9
MATLSQSTHQSGKMTPRRYHCIQCLKEADCLYRKLGPTSTSLKLRVCTNCGIDVDPYVEREAFLVAMDVVLLRQDAYRHLLLNRIAQDDGFDVSSDWRKAIRYVVASGILQTYLLWEAHHGDARAADRESLRDLLDRQDQGTISLLMNLFPQAVARILTLWAIAYVCIRQFSRRRTTNPGMLLTRSYLAVMIPTSFAVVTILILVWENTYTVRLLGSLLILTYQVLSIYTIASAEGLTPKESTVAIALAIVCNSFISWILSIAVGGLNGVPCAGLSYTIEPQLFLCFS